MEMLTGVRTGHVYVAQSHAYLSEVVGYQEGKLIAMQLLQGSLYHSSRYVF